MEEKTALVLSGGGAKGAFQVGVLQVLKEKGYRFDFVSGISVGSLNGSMLATGQFDELVRVWKNLTLSDVLIKQSLVEIGKQFLFYKIGLGTPPVSVYNNEPLRNLMRKRLIGEKVNIPFHFGYVKLETGEYVNAIIRQTNNHVINDADIDRVISSTAIPVMINPTYIGEWTCVDGGIRDTSPIRHLLPYEPDRMIIIPTKPVGAPIEKEESKDILAIAFRTINIMLDEIFQEDISRFLMINELVKQAEEQDAVLKKPNGGRYKYIEPLIIAPKESIGNPLDFENDRLNALIQMGRQRAEEVTS